MSINIENPVVEPEVKNNSQPSFAGVSIGTLLRSIGSVLILSASVCFLFSNWGEQDHISRYLAFLGLTSVVAGLGLVLGLAFRDDKAARTLLALGASLVPINFMQLGALIYSRVIAGGYLDSAVPVYGYFLGKPIYSHWQAESSWLLFLTLLLALPILTTISVIAFRTLSRSRFGLLSLAFLCTNTALLIPFRTGSISIILAFLVLMGSMELLTTKLIEDISLKNREGLLVKFLIPLPAVLITFRTLVLYSNSVHGFFLGMTVLAVALLFLRHLPRVTNEQNTVIGLHSIGAFLSLIFWPIMANDLTGLTLWSAQGAVVYFIPACLSLCFATRNCDQNIKIDATKAATVILVASQLIGFLAFPETLTVIAAIGASSAGCLIGFNLKNKGIFNASIIALAVCILYNIRFSFLLTINPWISIGCLGLLAMLGSVVYEKYNEQIRQLSKRFLNNFSFLN